MSFRAEWVSIYVRVAHDLLFVVAAKHPVVDALLGLTYFISHLTDSR